MSDDLERRAAHGARIHAHQAEARQRELTSRPVAPELNALATQALTEAASIRGLPIDAIVFLVTFLAVAVAVSLLRDNGKLAAITGVSIAVPGAIGTIIARWRRRVGQLHQALRWFDTLPFAFDRRHYLELLGRDRSGTYVELQIAFAATPTSQEMEMFANAASGSAAIARREAHGNVLVLRSVPLKTNFYLSDSGSYPNNRYAHAWMLAVTDGALRLIHNRQPIERVAVTMESASLE